MKENYKYSDVTDKIIKAYYNVYYDAHVVGDYYADIIVQQVVIIELKAAESLCEEHEIQLVNYLKATDIEVGLLLNFCMKAEFKRKVLTNEYKSNLY